MHIVEILRLLAITDGKDGKSNAFSIYKNCCKCIHNIVNKTYEGSRRQILQVLFVREESTNKENIQTLQYKHIKDKNTLMSNSIMAYMKFHNITIVLL